MRGVGLFHVLLVDRVEFPPYHDARRTVVDAVFPIQVVVPIRDAHRHTVAARAEGQDALGFPGMLL